MVVLVITFEMHCLIVPKIRWPALVHHDLPMASLPWQVSCNSHSFLKKNLHTQELVQAQT